MRHDSASMFMRRGFFLFLLGAAVFFSLPACAELDGTWSVVTGPGLGEDGKPVRSPDFFNLYLVSRGNLVCGSHDASGHNQNKIDFSRVFGRRVANRVALHFLNGFTGERTSFGIATFEVSGRRGKWEVIKEPEGESWVWRTANVKRTALSAKDRRAFEKACAGTWKRLAAVDFKSDIEVLKFLSEMGQM